MQTISPPPGVARRRWVRLCTTVRYAIRGRRLRRNLYWGAGLLLLAAAAWIVITGLLARAQIRALHDDLYRIRALISQGQLQDAHEMAAQLPAETHRIARLTSGPAWWLAAHVPYLGEPAETARGIASGLDRIGADAVPRLVDVVAKIDPARLRTSGDTIDLALLRSAVPDLEQAAASFDSAVNGMHALPLDTWLSPVNAAAASLTGQLDLVRGYVDAASRAAQVLPAMLGEERPMRYLIGLQNEAEMRGTGGLPGSFAVAEVNRGTVHFSEFFSDSKLLPAATHQLIDTGLDFGSAFDAAYGTDDATRLIVNSNVSPNFPYAARIWARMYEKTTGRQIDGVLAMDPTVLQYLLRATGPIDTPEGLVVSAANVVSLTQRDEYVLFPDNTARKNFLVHVLKQASKKVTSGAGSAAALARAFVEASKERRFLVWSALPSAEAALRQTTYAGTFGPLSRPLAAPILNNAAAGKLDYYLYRSLAYHRTGCGATRDVVVTITLTNTAPASGLPYYVAGRLDKDRPADAKPGDYRTLLDYYASAGAQLESVQLNGTPTQATVLHDLGRPIFRLNVELPRGATQTIDLHLTEPAGEGAPEIWEQPGVNPMAVTVHNQTC